MGARNLLLQNDELKTLTHLGLTVNQAKVYLALIQSGKSTAKTISQDSGIARHDIYRVITALEKLGFVDQFLGRPAAFKAIPLKVGISFLMKQKREQIIQVEKEARDLLENFKNSAKEMPHQDGIDFVLISGKQRIITETIKAWNNTLTSVDSISTSQKLFHLLFRYEKSYLNALNRGIKIRYIINEPKKSEPKIVHNLKKHQSFKIKYLPTIPSVHLGLYDRKNAIINTSAQKTLTDAPALLTNNQCILALILDYFEILWITAMENQQEEPQATKFVSNIYVDVKDKKSQRKNQRSEDYSN